MVALGHPLRPIETAEPKKKNPYYKMVENVRPINPYKWAIDGARSEDAKQALEKWISCFGNPEVLVTDNG